MLKSTIIGICILLLVSGCSLIESGYMSQEEADNAEWNGELEILTLCMIQYNIYNENGFSREFYNTTINADSLSFATYECSRVRAFCYDNEDFCYWNIIKNTMCSPARCKLNQWKPIYYGDCNCFVQKQDFSILPEQSSGSLIEI